MRFQTIICLGYYDGLLEGYGNDDVGKSWHIKKAIESNDESYVFTLRQVDNDLLNELVRLLQVPSASKRFFLVPWGSDTTFEKHEVEDVLARLEDSEYGEFVTATSNANLDTFVL